MQQLVRVAKETVAKFNISTGAVVSIAVLFNKKVTEEPLKIVLINDIRV